MEAEPQTEAVGQRHLLFDRFARVDAGGTFVLDHVARQQMAAVGRRVKNHIVRTAFDAAFEYRLERFVARIVIVEGQVVAEHEEAELRGARDRHQFGQALDILAVNFDQLERMLALGGERHVDGGLRGFDERRLAHAARAPQQRIVGRQAIGKTLGVLDQHVADPVDALEQRHLDAVDARHRHKPSVGVPDESVGGGQIGLFAALRREALERVGDSLQNVVLRERARLELSFGLCLGCGAALRTGFRLETGFGLAFGHFAAAFDDGAALSGAGQTPQAERPRNAQKCPYLRGLAALQLGLRRL